MESAKPVKPPQAFLLKDTRHYTIACFRDDRRSRNKDYVVVTYNFIGSVYLCRASLKFIMNKYHKQCFCFEKREQFEIQKDIDF